MSFFNQCKQCSVRVDGGSGVLFQPMTEAYSYILTAKHNLYDGTESNSYDNSKNTEDIKFTLYGKTESKNIMASYEHASLDIAILKIENSEFESPYKQFIQPKNRDEFKFYGYPENRREETEKTKYFDLKVGDLSGQEIVAENQSYYNQDDVVGCSGGGVFAEEGDKFYLVGIECRMDAESSSEQNNTRLRFIFIEAFEEIINDNNLIPLYPAFMDNFNLLVDNIFVLNEFEDKRDLVRNKLKYLATQATSQIKPLDIKEKFQNELFLNGHEINDISNEQFWSMYLEFILFSILVDDQDINIDAIINIYKKRKIFFAKTDRWVELKEDILKSNLYGLEKKGIILIACDGDRRPNKCELSTKTIINISNPPQIEEMKIDRGVDYTTDFKYKHIFSIEKYILDNEAEFVNSTNQNIEDKIKEVVQNVF